MNPFTENRRHITRRALLGRTATGIGAAALSHLFRNEFTLGVATSQPAYLSFAPKAKRVIYMFQNGAPSHVDLFDYKPMLKKMHGKEIPKDIIGDKRFSTMTGTQKSKPVLSEITKFAQHG